MIKKIILLFLCVSVLSSCKHHHEDEYIYSPIIFSEVIKSTSAYDRALEIANISNETQSLDSFSVNIYPNNETKPIQIIPLSGELEPNETLVIAHSLAKDEIISKADIIIEDLKVDGTWPISLKMDGKVVDVLGIIGYQNDYASKADLVRKKEFFVNRNIFNPYDWIKYPEYETSFLGNLDITLTNEEMLEGPKLSKENFERPFIVDGKGTGGAVEVNLGYVGDGDTTTFRFPSSVTGEYVSSSESVRYLGINTPEIQHGDYIDAQPWGYEAKEYNNNILRNAKHFVIQTAVNGAIRETYGRFLAFVWYSNEENPSYEDYTLLNFEMVREAYAFQLWMEPSHYVDPNVYEKISYRSLFDNAELKAKNEGKRIHGETDPNFVY